MNAIAHTDSGSVPSVRFRFRRIALLALVLIAFNLGGGWLVAQFNIQVWPRHNDIIELMVLTIFVAYIVTMMLPFVPGIEIGIAIMLLLGQGGIVLVYLCTQIALALSFLIGRFVPKNSVHSFLRSLRLERAKDLLEVLDRPTPFLPARRTAGRTPPRWYVALLRNRYLALAVILNLPGNAVIGGAGGIGAIAGSSRLFRFSRYMLVVALATTPVPVFFLLSGVS